MLACDKFLFLHLHKSGGTFVNQLMMTCLPGTRKIGYHLPASAIPETLAALPVLGTVRNPLAYYVSWYHFQRGLEPSRRNILFRLMSNDGADDFVQTVTRLVTLSERPALVAALAEQLPPHFVGSGLNLTRGCVATLAGSGEGFYSFLYRRAYDAAPGLTLLRAEELRPALGDFLDRHYPALPLWRRFLAEAPDMNRSRHGPVADLYPPDLRRLVARFDAPVFERHAYPDS